MRLLADRFVINDDGPVVDLATGAPVIIITAAAGSTQDQLQWTLCCDRWRTLQHRAVAPLLDFGLIGATDRFEAWRCGAPWTGSAGDADAVREAAERFLHAAAMIRGSGAARSVHHGPQGPLIVPDTGTAYPNGSHEPIDAMLPIEQRGLCLIPRPACASLAEMADVREGCRSRVAVLWGPAGSGRATVVRDLSRIARLNGLVPVASPLLDGPCAELWQGRSLFIIAGDSASAWTAALRSTLRSPRPHVVLIVSNCEQRGVDAVRLAPVEAEALASAVFPTAGDPDQVRRIRRAAVRARGLPGRFVQLLWRQFDYERSPRTDLRVEGGLRVAEARAAYGDPKAAGEPSDSAAVRRLWPAAGELADLRRRLDAAQVLIEQGRHGPGLRHLRHAVGGLARRDEWSSAADGALIASSCLLRRGRPRDAHKVLDEARDYAVRASRDPLLVDVATLSGEAWIDLARLDEAETVLAAAVTTARGLGDRSRTAATAITLARCLYWRGRYAEASSALVDGSDGAANGDGPRADLLGARIAIGRGQLDRATSLSSQARAAARASGNPRTTAAASYCAGLVHLAVGDLDAADRDLSEAIGAARRGHDPLRAARVRMMQAELERRRGRQGAALAQFERLERISRTLPPLLRARVDLLRVVLGEANRSAANERVSRLVAATGLGALTVYAGGSHPAGSAESIDSLAGEVIAIVRACQTAADEVEVLKEVCGRVRRQIHAAAVAFTAGPRQRYGVLAAVGSRIDSAVAERAMAAGITIAPHRHEDRVEGAVPVHYGGAPIGALCARWTLGSTDDIRRASATLEMAAAAAAPIVSACLGHRDVAVRASSDLVGVTPPMVELRRSVERAAAAPFPVLIEGESGSGKELVARGVHRRGTRRDRTFCTLNCAALPDELIEAELFGHARGAFTGAVVERAGVFEEAHGGTLFLDEIGELSPRAQAKVLRVIQEGELRRVGENLPRRVDVRIIAATNRDLRREVESGRFRADLWYRLDVIRIAVPPLRERREDILVLAEHFWREASQRVGGKATLAAATLAALARYDWPGNVRELQNVLAALAVRSPRRGVVPPTALPPQFDPRDGEEAWRFGEARQAFEERFVRAALVRSGGHRGRAAAELGVTRQGLTKLMTRLGITADDETSTTE